MGLLKSPVITKFFSHKIESSLDDWGDYLLEVADIFSTFDGEELDRDLLTDRFSAISGRSPYALRDVANFRDEFGAYGTYLGLYRVEKENDKWKIYLSDAAKHFLCSTEPDVESFCRTQMALFQYPNGAGAAHIQANILKDTKREIQNNIRINPFRLICKLVQVYHKYEHIPISAVEIPYETLFLLMNDDRINTQFSPDNEDIYAVLTEYKIGKLPPWASIKNSAPNFKRNFHIFDWTGMFKHTKNGLHIADGDTAKTYSYIQIIANMDHDFNGFESCYGSSNIEMDIKSVISSPAWGKYFDSYTMPTQTLRLLSDSITDENGILHDELPFDYVKIETQPFPLLRDYQSNQIRTFSPSGKNTDPFETIIRREKANRDHGRILSRIASTIRANNNNYKVFENIFIDLLAVISHQDFIFEVKSNNTKNALSQIRKAVAQLYEYRYRSGKQCAILCIVLQQKPVQNWVIDYLVKDRDIMICWMTDDFRFECPPECLNKLSPTGIIQ